MGIGSIFSRLFGGSREGPAVPEQEPEDYNGFLIVPRPQAEGGQFRTAGTIRKEVDGQPREVGFVRADLHPTLDAAVQHSLAKGRQIVDEQGERMFSAERV